PWLQESGSSGARLWPPGLTQPWHSIEAQAMGCCISTSSSAGDASPASAISSAALAQEELRRAADALSPEERPPPAQHWNFLGGEELVPLLEHTTLVDAHFLVALADAGGVVPRWQELPEAAKIGPANAWQLRCGATCTRIDNDVIRTSAFLPILVLSYPWFDRTHPDRLGETLQRVAPVLRAMLSHTKELAQLELGCLQHDRGLSSYATVGVLWDFLSLPQKPHRDDSETQRFKAGLKAIDRWYAHPHTTVLLVTTPVPNGDGKYENRRPYQNRGWCKFERSISMLTKHRECLLDLGKVPDGWVWGRFRDSEALRVLSASRRPPLSPDAFAKQVRAGVQEGTVAFTAGAVDEEFVIEQYRKGFIQAYNSWGDTYNSLGVEQGDKVNLTNLGWGSDDAFVLADAIKYAGMHCSPKNTVFLDLRGNNFDFRAQDELYRSMVWDAKCYKRYAVTVLC
ncbi:unnamed protein product, partial [Prorocentrum cordatum]